MDESPRPAERWNPSAANYGLTPEEEAKLNAPLSESPRARYDPAGRGPGDFSRRDDRERQVLYAVIAVLATINVFAIGGIIYYASH